MIGDSRGGYTQFRSVNYAFNVDQTIGASQDRFALKYNNGTGEIELMADSNLYNINGTLTSARTVGMGGNKLTFDGSSQDITIDAAGQVGIDNASPAFDLDVNGDIYSGFTTLNGYVLIQGKSTDGGSARPRIILNDSTANTAGAVIAGDNGGLQFYGDDDIAGTPPLQITKTGIVTLNDDISIAKTITTAGTTGNRTINKMAGTVNIAAAGTSVTVTNSFVTANSLVFCTLRTNDSTAWIKNVVPAAGSFTVNLGAAATGEVSIGFMVIN